MKSFSSLQEDLRKWFSKTDPSGDWKRINSKGEVVGPCAREPGEPKPKCMSAEKRASLTKKERAAAVRAKRKHDPNPERKGEPINVSNFGKGKISENMENLNEKNVPTNPELWSRAKSLARSKFDVYPSAYANGWASKWYKGKGGSWKSVDEAVKDKYDEGEYDQEGDMAKSDLRSIIANAKELHDMIDDADNLPEWCQNKITLAEDYISTVANYMAAEMNEEVKDEYARKVEKYLKKKYKKEEVEPIEEATSAAVRFQRALEREREKRERNERAGAALLKPKQPEAPMKKEEVKDEYARKVDKYLKNKYNKDDKKKQPQGADFAAQRRKERLAKNGRMDENTLEEGRPSQRHPLEGHEYHKKSDEALIHIAKDAHAAAEAMKSHNTTAENKYRDQANDSATVRHFRKTSGTPDWYKKKYGHMKESFRPMDEPNYNNSIEARQKKADNAAKRFMDNSVQDRQAAADKSSTALSGLVAKKNLKQAEGKKKSQEFINKMVSKVNAAKRLGEEKDDKPPFDPPYKKSTGVVTDKSGAKHGGMSIARHLAKQAIKKQTSKPPVKESLKESRKAEIVKEIMKKGKKKDENKFQAEPELGASVVKADN